MLNARFVIVHSPTVGHARGYRLVLNDQQRVPAANTIYLTNNGPGLCR